MLEEFLIRHSAPTLAGLKTGNLFWYPWEDRKQLEGILAMWEEILREKGLKITVMKINGKRALLYVYRKSRLEADLQRRETRQILKKRIGTCGAFPHEIGLFLGYPEADVKGFIENEGRNCKCCGCWKVYCNECDARKTFRKFKKCEAVYEKLFLMGRPVKKLIVAA